MPFTRFVCTLGEKMMRGRREGIGRVRGGGEEEERRRKERGGGREEKKGKGRRKREGGGGKGGGREEKKGKGRRKREGGREGRRKGKNEFGTYERRILLTFTSFRTKPSSPCLITFMIRSDKVRSSSC
jgi:hypothetical protein